jgi:hypothetical protein
MTNYLLTLLGRLFCSHEWEKIEPDNYKYAAAFVYASKHPDELGVYECQKCFKIKYELEASVE